MKILFLGDSITDCDHCFTEDNLGNGYVKYVAAQLENASIINAGTDSFTFPRILQKWQSNYSSSSFDTVIISGGINDVSIMMNTGLTQEQSDDWFHYSMTALQQLIDSLITGHTKKVLILEPFLLPAPAYLSLWLPCLEKFRGQIRRIARTFDTDTVHTICVQDALDTLVRQKGVHAVTTDGIHLTAAGHQCLARIVIASI